MTEPIPSADIDPLSLPVEDNPCGEDARFMLYDYELANFHPKDGALVQSDGEGNERRRADKSDGKT